MDSVPGTSFINSRSKVSRSVPPVASPTASAWAGAVGDTGTYEQRRPESIIMCLHLAPTDAGELC
eukprot:6203339-Pleurochrysis_carterae.AAC.1